MELPRPMGRCLVCGCHRRGVVGALCHSSTRQALLRRGPCEDSKPPASMQQVPPVEPPHMSLRALPMVIRKPSSGEPPQGPPQPIAKCVWSSAVPAAAKGGLPPAVRAACAHRTAFCQPGLHWRLLWLLFGNPVKTVRAKHRFFQSPRSTQTSRKKRCMLNSCLGMHSFRLLPCQA